MRLDTDMKWIGELCVHYDIGDPSEAAEPVAGGLLHRMWKLRTATGNYALKLLNPEIMSRAGVTDNYLLSERIAAAAAMAGIPAVLAKTVDDRPLSVVSGTAVMVFDWIEGTVLAPAECRTEHADIIGSLIYRIHHMNFQGRYSPLWKSFEQPHWQALLEEGVRKGMPWAQQFDSGFKELLDWNDRYGHASKALNRSMAFGHRDLNPKNVVWKEGYRPFIIDWESAGPTNPAMELLDAALSWSGLDAGAVHKEVFMAMINAYRKAGGTALTNVEEAFYGRMGSMLEWLEYNMRRSMRKEVFSEPEQRLGTEQVLLTLSSLKEMSANIGIWTDWAEAESG